ncbi:MAG TPA: glycosyltransferase [Candidatus Saccharimonadales bacterium]|nr:glycosyltransferase [Candidatus Saccharimonadales bacterium]
MRSISVIVPTLNEGSNIGRLIERVNATMFYQNIAYEIIVIDDHSTDNTRAIVKHLSKRFPLTVKLKQGQPGKAQSLIEGFSYAKYDVLCMIDADLQYDPEVIPSMLDKIENGADIIVANRNFINTSFIRNLMSRTFSYIFGNLIHGMRVDVQSGLKVFRKEIIERLTINPSPWTFDLEFLKKSVDAGYQIDSIQIEFIKRRYGKSKINFFKSSWEIGLQAIKLKFQKREAIPFHPNEVLRKGHGFHHKGKEFVHYSQLSPKETAYKRLILKQKLQLVTLGLILVLSLLLNWHVTIISLLALLTVLYFADLIYNLNLIVKSFTHPAEIIITEKEVRAIRESDWPTYTVFCPLYREWKVVPQFITAMSRLDYPKDRLQVMLLLEANDRETIEAIKQIELPTYFEIVIVPDSFPKTKPKACNFGLTKATGDFAVIYDAEDIPDPLQLKKSVLGFAKSDPSTVCLQAKLNFYNSKQNLLTRIFTAEYSLWFDLILTGLQSINAPIPLGGTSNHFKTQALRYLNGWDSFNVTEDADLGIRLVKAGYRTAIIDSQTLEEANSSLKNWFNQRSRWIKGYIQTYLVHTRDMNTFLPEKRKFNIISMQLIIGGKVLSLFINPLMWAVTISYFALRPLLGSFITSFFPSPVLYMGVISLVVGNFLYLYYYMIGCAKHGHYHLIQYIFLVPLYWLSMSIASWIALVQFIVAPHYWPKTRHGLHFQDKITSTFQQEFTKPYAGNYGQI